METSESCTHLVSMHLMDKLLVIEPHVVSKEAGAILILGNLVLIEK